MHSTTAASDLLPDRVICKVWKPRCSQGGQSRLVNIEQNGLYLELSRHISSFLSFSISSEHHNIHRLSLSNTNGPFSQSR